MTALSSAPPSSTLLVRPRPRCSCFFHLVLRFWNQIFTCCSVTHNSLQEKTFLSCSPLHWTNLLRWDLSVALRYFLVSNIFSLEQKIFTLTPSAPHRLTWWRSVSRWRLSSSSCACWCPWRWAWCPGGGGCPLWSAGWRCPCVCAGGHSPCSAPSDGRLTTKRQQQAVTTPGTGDTPPRDLRLKLETNWNNASTKPLLDSVNKDINPIKYSPSSNN